MAEQFSLRWNDFHSNLSSAFHALLEDGELVDVTLAAGGKYIQAHKLILSVCSPYFKELFKMNPCKHPIVILKDVEVSELRHILQFMYRGEVNVKQHELTSFLQTAEMLQVKGLTVGRERSPTPPPMSENDIVYPYVHAPQSNANSDDNNKGWTSHEECSSDIHILREEETKSPLKRLLTNTPKANHQKKRKADPVHDLSDYMLDNDQLNDCEPEMYHSVDLPESAKESLIKQDGWNCKTNGVKCPTCDRFFANRYNLKVHIRDKHETLEGMLKCEICHKRMRNPSCLRVHMYHHRKQAASQASQLPQLYLGSDIEGATAAVGLLGAAQKCHPKISISPPQFPEIVGSPQLLEKREVSPGRNENFNHTDDELVKIEESEVL